MQLIIINKWIKKKYQPDLFTYIRILQACTDICNINLGDKIYQEIVNKRISITSQLYISLINLYGKCNNLEKALSIFNKIDNSLLNINLWNTILSVLKDNNSFS